MKKNITLKEAWDITNEFANYLANRKITPVSSHYEKELPRPKKDILLAMLKVLTDESPSILSKKIKNLEIKEYIKVLIISLEEFIPNSDEYKEKVKNIENFNDFVNQYGKDKFSEEEDLNKTIFRIHYKKRNKRKNDK